MKMRDLLVILFTASVALLLFLRSARADGSRIEDGADSNDEQPLSSNVVAGDPGQGQSLHCKTSPGAATTTLLNSLAAFLTVGLVARRRRR